MIKLSKAAATCEYYDRIWNIASGWGWFITYLQNSELRNRANNVFVSWTTGSQSFLCVYNLLNIKNKNKTVYDQYIADVGSNDRDQSRIVSK